MQILYVDQYGTTYWSGEQSVIPRIGEKVVFDEEEFILVDIMWYPNTQQVFAYIADQAPREELKVVQEKLSNATEIKTALRQSADALKETRALRREIFTVRQSLKSQIKST
jgi:hypothetical protein